MNKKNKFSKIILFTSYDDGSWSLLFHLSNILIVVDCYTLAMTKMKCSILGHIYIYTGTDVFVRSRKRKKNERTNVREILSLHLGLIYTWMSIGSTICIQVYIAQWTDERKKGEERAKDFDHSWYYILNSDYTSIYNCLYTLKVYYIYSLDYGHIFPSLKYEQKQQSKQE